MGCTYSEDVDVSTFKAAVPVPVLAHAEDLAMVGGPLPLDTPFDGLQSELCLEVHPVTWYKGGQDACLCHTMVQGVPMGRLELYTDHSSTIIFPVTTKALGSVPIALTFETSRSTKVGTIAVDVPAYSVEKGEVTTEFAHDIWSPLTEQDGEAEAKQQRVGRVAVTVKFTPHPEEADKMESAPTNQRLTVQYLVSNESMQSTCPSAKDDTGATSSGSSPNVTAENGRVPLKTILAGVRQSVSVCEHSWQTLSPRDLGRDGSAKHTLENGAVEMKVFAPKAFNNIRHMDGITPTEYQLEWDLHDDKLVLAPGAGRSGSLFLRSNTNRFILKTIPYAEVCTLLSIFEGYYHYLVEQPDSFIMHVHGLYRFWFSGSWLYVILFTNILHSESPLPVHIFDLKGRVAKPGKLMARRNAKGIVWKDKDLERFFFLPQDANDRYRKQLAADVAFLDTHNMMDYSLLVGVRERPKGYAPSEKDRNRSFFRSFMGGTPGTDECQEVYYIGIIDCLTKYSSKKKVANFCKQMLWTMNTLSTVPSKEYATRFLNFMYAIFPTESEVSSPALRHPNLSLPIAALDTLLLNRNQVASPLVPSNLAPDEFHSSDHLSQLPPKTLSRPVSPCP